MEDRKHYGVRIMTKMTSLMPLFFLAVVVKTGYTGEHAFKERYINGFKVQLDTVGATPSEQLINSNIDKMAQIYETFKPAKLAKLSSTAKEAKIIKTGAKEKEAGYELKNDKRSLISANFDKNNCIRKIYFDASGFLGRNYTPEEKIYHDKTGKIPSTYCTISKNQAIEMAKKLLLLVYGKKEYEKFDSIVVQTYDKTYGVIFKIKRKNDIADRRTSAVIINPNTGLIERFSSEGLSKVEFDYIPKITKVQAMQIYWEEVNRLGANITVDSTKVLLEKYSETGENGRWAWNIYGVRHDKNLGHTAFMAIDSETGDVLGKSMDY
jgi:hypothetical protein